MAGAPLPLPEPQPHPARKTQAERPDQQRSLFRKMNRDFDPSAERKRGEPSWRGRSAFSRGPEPDKPVGSLPSLKADTPAGGVLSPTPTPSWGRPGPRTSEVEPTWKTVPGQGSSQNAASGHPLSPPHLAPRPPGWPECSRETGPAQAGLLIRLQLHPENGAPKRPWPHSTHLS